MPVYELLWNITAQGLKARTELLEYSERQVERRDGDKKREK